MGKPATTYWCENGHLLEHNSSHVFGEYDYEEMPYPPCEVCQSINVVMLSDWGESGRFDFEVPITPIRRDEVEKIDCRGNKYYIEVPVYNVSKLLQK